MLTWALGRCIMSINIAYYKCICTSLRIKRYAKSVFKKSELKSTKIYTLSTTLIINYKTYISTLVWWRWWKWWWKLDWDKVEKRSEWVVWVVQEETKKIVGWMEGKNCFNFMHGYTTWKFAINTEVHKEKRIISNVIHFKMGQFFHEPLPSNNQEY